MLQTATRVSKGMATRGQDLQDEVLDSWQSHTFWLMVSRQGGPENSTCLQIFQIGWDQSEL